MEQKIKFESFEEMKNYRFIKNENTKSDTTDENNFFEMMHYLRSLREKNLNEKLVSNNNATSKFK